MKTLIQDLTRMLISVPGFFLITAFIFSFNLSGNANTPDGNNSVASALNTLTVGVVQMRSSKDINDNIARIKAYIHDLAGKGVRVAVFPECAVSSYHKDMLTTVNASQLILAEKQVADACREAGIYAVLGTPYFEGDKYYNSATIISPEGKVIERYHKVQLAGETWFTGGDHLSVFNIDGFPCSVIICHDERYPELVRLPVLAGAKLIFYISHESGIREEKKISPYRAQIKARAVENTVYIAHSNAPANYDTSGSHGQSRIITPTGNIMEEASIFEEDILIAELDMSKATRGNALRSLNRGPFKDWWEEGVKRVKIIE